MSLPSGTRLGPYEILAPIGAGGMGEVYRARDTRLDRIVAIKTSKQQFSERFEREARAVAALNHPNICQVYDVGPDYLVMELVEGPTLADRIHEGPLPLDEALAIARQIADALEAAHDKGIVHRDLKPANVKLKPEGSGHSVKVLDFGLAKITGPAVHSSSSGNPAHSPTLTIGMTAAGMILGTAAYMSPEQARGKENVDKRADIWAFGVVLYEMLTARRLFEGEDIGETLASVIKAEPKWDGVPPQVRRLLEKCLQKDPRKRLRDIGDMPLLLEQAPPSAAPEALPQPLTRRFPWAWGTAAVLALSTLLLGFVHGREKSPPPPNPMRFEMAPPGKGTIEYLALSPNGRKLAMTVIGSDGRQAVWVRSLDATEIQKLPGTEGAGIPLAWSPDSHYIAFGLSGKLSKIDPSGGPPETICPVGNNFLGLSWNQQDTILFSSKLTLARVAATGGDPVEVTALDQKRKEIGQGWPAFLPDGKHFLYFRLFGTEEGSGLYLGSLDAKPEAQDAKRLVEANSGALYAGSADAGSLLYLRGDALMERPFAPARGEFTGEPARLADRVGVTGNYGGLFTVSANGLLALSAGGSAQRQLTWYDRQGKILSHPGDVATRDEIALSPDGTRLVEGRTDAAGVWVVWQLDLARGTNARFTFDPGGAGNATWSPDGTQIVYAPGGGSSTDLYRKPANGAGKEQLIVHGDSAMTPLDWSRDGKFLLYATRGKDTGRDLWVLPDPGKAAGDIKPAPYLVTPQTENQAKFSPDGQFVSYTSNESGAPEVYVRPFPASSGGKWLISNGGGTQARWRPDGKELFYVTPDSMLMAVQISTKPVFQAGVAKPLFRVPVAGGEGGAPGIAWRWDISPDGQRFLVNAAPEDRSSTPITVVANWNALLRK
jgi:eukaryotic-like serine/threonine-protein kinase